jgi:hypothetical protein
MKNKYQLMEDEHGEWISAPNNGGDLGGMVGIVEELNYLLYQNEKLWTMVGDLKLKLNIIVKDLEQHTK